MVEYVGDIAERRTEWTKAYASRSSILPNALGQIDSAVWLIAGARYSQSLVALQTAIELLLKFALVSIDPMLIVNRTTDRTANAQIKRGLQRNPQVQSLSTKDIVFEKTITVTDAIRLVKKYHPELGKWELLLDGLRDARNKVTHHSSDGDDQYVQLICTSAIPFLEVFVPHFAQIDLEKFIGRNIYREIAVAREVCEKLAHERATKFAYALKTVRTAVLHRDVDFPAPVDPDGWRIDDGDREWHTAQCLKRELLSTWPGLLVEVNCKICESANAYAGIDDFDEDDPVAMSPRSLACAQCGLRIEPGDIGLAQAHFGLISPEVIKKSAFEVDC